MEYGLTLRLDKSKFLAEIAYFGHTGNSSGITPEVEKISVIKNVNVVPRHLSVPFVSKD